MDPWGVFSGQIVSTLILNRMTQWQVMQEPALADDDVGSDWALSDRSSIHCEILAHRTVGRGGGVGGFEFGTPRSDIFCR